MATSATTAAEPGERRARTLDGLRPVDAELLGDEVHDLLALRAAGVPVAEGWVSPLDGGRDELVERLRSAWRRQPRPPPAGDEAAPPATQLLLWPWFRTMSLAMRVEARWPRMAAVADPVELPARLEALSGAVLSPATRAAAGPAAGAPWLRALLCDAGPLGRSCSVDPDDGDPSCVAVWKAGGRPWRLDRKTMRPLEEQPEPELPQVVLERAADLADRAQLALGRPVEIDWVMSAGRPVVARVRPVSVGWRFTDEAFRLVSLLWHDEGPVAPLAVDGLDKALREDDDPMDVARIRRVFARPYRRLEEGRVREGERRHPFGAAATRAAQVVRDVARPIAAAREFTRTLRERLTSFDGDDLARLDDVELARALRERQNVVIEAYALLDRGRKATAAVLGAIEASVGTIPRDCIYGLAAIRRTRSRRKLDEKLARAAADLVGAQGVDAMELDPPPAAHRQRFAELRRQLAQRRPLGLDIRPDAYGASDRALADGMRAARDGRAEKAEQEQRRAIRRLMATARARPLGRGRAALARTLTLMIERLADAKGTVAEGLSEATLRMRQVAIEIGRRLTERGILDEPEDALYLYVTEINDALAGEPGAYTARVRLRREEDMRWRGFEPPTKLRVRRGRRSH